MIYFRGCLLLWVVAHSEGESQSCTCRTIRAIASSEAAGWEETCDDVKFLGKHPAEQCRTDCCKDQACTVWFRNTSGCFHGQAEKCGHLQTGSKRRHSAADNKTFVGQVVVRGVTVVNAPQFLQRCEGLQEQIFHAPMAKTGADLMVYRSFALSGVERCRSVCYANPSCTVWQYGAKGCFYSNSDVLCAPDEAVAATLTAGEYITNQCHAVQSQLVIQDAIQHVLQERRSVWAAGALFLASGLSVWAVLRGSSCGRHSEEGRVRTAGLEDCEAITGQQNECLTAKVNVLQPQAEKKQLRKIMLLPQFLTGAPPTIPLPVRSTPSSSSGAVHVQYMALQPLHVQ